MSQAGIASRREAEDLIRSGQVQVNGQVVTTLGTKADPRRDQIKVKGRMLHGRQEMTYLLLNKPVGVMTTLSDPEGRPTIKDLLRQVRVKVFPVGRLDFHSSGLLLLTNDGELAFRLMHPRYQVPKTYHVKVKGEPTAQALERFGRGVSLEDGKTAPALARVLQSKDKKTWLEITLTEGRKREIRRMCERIGHSVEKLTRVQLGPLTLGKLPRGEYRALSEGEIFRLRTAVKLPKKAKT